MLKTVITGLLVTSISAFAFESRMICIAGASASGKTTFAKKLHEAFGEELSVVVNLDNYYLAQPGLTQEEQARFNWGHPSAINWPLLREHLTALKQGQSIQIPIYDFITSNPSGEYIVANPAKFIIFEGDRAFYDETVREDLCNDKIFIDVPEEQRLQRLILRDKIERGRSEERTRYQHQTFSEPMYKKFVEITKTFPGIHVINAEQLDETLDVIRFQ